MSDTRSGYPAAGLPPLERLVIITTGGTIDKVYFDQLSDYQIGEPQIVRVLRDMQVAFTFEITQLMRKDSLAMDDSDRAAIRAAIEASTARHFIVTHGTDTMIETARALAGLGDKVVVLTGALQPAGFIASDAVFNIGTAVGAVQALPAGIWIVMNGRVWHPGRVRKNRQRNCFEPLDPTVA